MLEKIISILETLGALAIVAAVATWSSWYHLSDILFWVASALFVPVIIWKARHGDIKKWLITIVCLALYFTIGLWWFNGPKIKVNIPKLPPITISRQA